MSFWDLVLYGSPPGPGSKPASSAAATAAAEDNLLVLSGIESPMNPFIEGALEWITTSLSDSAVGYLEDGEMAIYYSEIEDFVEYSINEGELVKLYYGISPLGAQGDLRVSTDTDSNPVTITVTYASAEREKLRDLFGQPENSTVSSLIDDAITAVGQFASSMNLDTRFKSNAVKTPAFTDADLTLLTDEEAAQGISLSMASALTRVKEVEAEPAASATSTGPTPGALLP
jgi:hypothetical protein